LRYPLPLPGKSTALRELLLPGLAPPHMGPVIHMACERRHYKTPSETTYYMLFAPGAARACTVDFYAEMWLYGYGDSMDSISEGHRTVYTGDDIIILSEYIPSLDVHDRYACWSDADTQSGYNHKFSETFEEFTGMNTTSRLSATIMRKTDCARVGGIFMSSEDAPDLAIMIYKPYRGMGYGTRTFMLGSEYCLNELGCEMIYAGCYTHNTASMKMLLKCGFVPHPEGNLHEKHYLTGEDIVQYDFVKYKRT